MLPILLLALLVVLSAIVTWLAYGRRRTRFVVDFAKLLESPRSVDGVGDWIAKSRSICRRFCSVLRLA